MQARARDCLRTRTPLPQLQQLVEDAAELPVALPELEAAAALLQKAQDWLKRAQVAANQVRLLLVVMAADAGDKFIFAQCDLCHCK